jgi:hypothetical protein
MDGSFHASLNDIVRKIRESRINTERVWTQQHTWKERPQAPGMSLLGILSSVGVPSKGFILVLDDGLLSTISLKRGHFIPISTNLRMP